LGSVGSAANKVALKNVNVTHILTVAGKIAPAYPVDFVYKVIDGKIVLLLLLIAYLVM
jgi:protein phosphatase slingshot